MSTATAPAPDPATKNVDREHGIVGGKPLDLDKFRATNWTDRDEIIALWPIYAQHQMALSRQKTISKTIDIPLNLRKPLSAEYLLQSTDLLIEPNKRICLVGEPSSGKSVLLTALASGELPGFPKHLNVHHCKEYGVTEKDISVIDAVVLGHDFRNTLLACEAFIRAALEQKRKDLEILQAFNKAEEEAGREELDEDDLDSDIEALQANLEMVKFQLNKIASDTAYERAAKMLTVLGFDEVGQKRSTNSLSGGLRMRVALCAAFFMEPDLLLLDEPTNHLDFPSVLWLENRLRGYRNSFLLISHDREMLDNVCTSLIAIENKKLVYYNMGFPAYEKKKAADEKKMDEDIDKWMLLNRNVDAASQKAKEKADKQAWQLKFREKQLMLQGKFTFPDMTPLTADAGDDAKTPDQISIINLKNVRFSYGPDKGLPWIFDTPINLNVMASTRMGIMGPNGAGKSTLLKLLTKRLIPVEGSVTQHSTATIAYFAQHHAAELDMEMTPMEYMIKSFPTEAKQALLKKHLGKVGITATMADTRLKSLTAGQRSCVMFAKITYVCPHLLIMDEPTNFLDLESVDSLISATNKYPGALLLVSHNRDFLKKCAKQYLSVVPGKFAIYDDMKACEKGTYSFIAELEAGASAGKLSGALLKKGKGGQLVEEKEPERPTAPEYVLQAAKEAAAANAAPPPQPKVIVDGEDEDEDGEGDDEKNEEDEKEAAARAAAEAAAKLEARRAKGPCKFYQSKAGCKSGDNCIFSHDGPAGPQKGGKGKARR